jgi:hypothetical protein
MSMYGRFLREVASAGLPSVPGSAEIITIAQLASLPEAAQRYLRFMGVVGRPQDWSFRFAFTRRFRSKPPHPWMRFETWQYNHRPSLARIFDIRIKFLVPVIGRDTYIQGRGRMLIGLLDVFRIEGGTGEKYDIGKLVTYLNDAVLIAPSMLLVPEISWVL